MNCPEYKNYGNMFLFKLTCIAGGIIFGLNIALFNNFGNILLDSYFDSSKIMDKNKAIGNLNLFFGLGGLVSCILGGFLMKLLSRRISVFSFAVANIVLTIFQICFQNLEFFYFLRFCIGFTNTYYTFLIPIMCKEYLRNKCRGPMISWFYVGIAFGTFLPSFICLVSKDFFNTDSKSSGHLFWVGFWIRIILMIPAFLDFARLVILYCVFNCESPHWELVRIISSQPERYKDVYRGIRSSDVIRLPQEDDIDRVPINYGEQNLNFRDRLEDEENDFLNEDSVASEDSNESEEEEDFKNSGWKDIDEEETYPTQRRRISGDRNERNSPQTEALYEPLNLNNNQIENLDEDVSDENEIHGGFNLAQRVGSFEGKLLRDLKNSASFKKYHSTFFPKATFVPVAKFMTSEFSKTFDKFLIAKSYKFINILVHPRYRLQVFVIILLNFLNQMTGINCLIFYSSNIFKKLFFDMKKENSSAPEILSLMVGLANVVGSLIVPFLINYVGRRGLIFLGLGVQCLSLFGMQVSVIEYWYILGLTSIYLFVLGFAISLGSTLYTYQTEILPAQAIPIVSVVEWSLTFLISSYDLSDVTQSQLFSLSFLFFMTSLFGFFIFQGYSIETKSKSDSKILSRWAKKTFMDA